MILRGPQLKVGMLWTCETLEGGRLQTARTSLSIRKWNLPDLNQMKAVDQEPALGKLGRERVEQVTHWPILSKLKHLKQPGIFSESPEEALHFTGVGCKVSNFQFLLKYEPADSLHNAPCQQDSESDDIVTMACQGVLAFQPQISVSPHLKGLFSTRSAPLSPPAVFAPALRLCVCGVCSHPSKPRPDLPKSDAASSA